MSLLWTKGYVIVELFAHKIRFLWLVFFFVLCVFKAM